MKERPIELEYVEVEIGADITVGNKVSRITLDNTGRGVMGYYDVITVYGESISQYPAHQCFSWGIKKQP